jgi:hypothetical protein
MTSLPPINPATEPAVIRNGNQAAKQAYREGLAFEQMLVDQLGQELAKTVSPDDTSAGGVMGSDPASTAYSQLIPSALTTGLMSAGGTGIALELATAFDPSIRSKS